MESKQAYARGTEDYFEEQLIPIRRLDSTTPPRPARSWIICCMCWLEGTALTCNTWLLQKYSVLPSLIGFLSSVCFFFFFSSFQSFDTLYPLHSSLLIFLECSFVWQVIHKGISQKKASTHAFCITSMKIGIIRDIICFGIRNKSLNGASNCSWYYFYFSSAW